MAPFYPSVRLLSITPALLRDLEAPAVEFWTSYRARLGDVADRVGELVRQTLEVPAEGFLVVEPVLDQVVGLCGFKGPPTSAGEIEIAYATFPAFEGKGYATAAARELIGRAGARKVVAHTRPGPGASPRILQKLGFLQVGELQDPDDGPVWRWELGTNQTV